MEPLGKDLAPFNAADSLKVVGGGTGPEGRVGEAAYGCLPSISFRISEVGVAKPFEERALVAFQY